jgi:Zn-dependent peptidase ImmA (M78 family)
VKRGAYRRGFKAGAERLALEVREELRVGVHDRLDPRNLAEHLAIDILPLAALEELGASATAIAHLHGPGRDEFSAATVFRGTVRLIVENESHAPGRRANSVAHEISHVLLEHEPHVVRDGDGGRLWLPEMEREATWLAGAILVPNDAAHRIARAGTLVETAAARFGVSGELMNWRLQETGALIVAERARARRGRGW